MATLTSIFSDPRSVPALIALTVALASLARAEAARIDAANAIKRAGGRRQTPSQSAKPAPGQPERRNTQ